MLVLSRKRGEELVFPLQNMRISVLRVGRGQVQFGIEAPNSVRIVRGELLRQPPSTRATGTLPDSTSNQTNP